MWDVDFGPQGFYFATASHDRTARLWSCDHIYPLRIFAGHLSDVDVSNKKKEKQGSNKGAVCVEIQSRVRMLSIVFSVCDRMWVATASGIG